MMTNYKTYLKILMIINLTVVAFSSCFAAMPNQTGSSSKNYFILSQQQWSIPKNAQSILNMPALRSVMPGLLQDDQQILVIRYPGGEVGILWASELKGWLASLGVSSERIELQTGSLKADELQLFIK